MSCVLVIEDSEPLGRLLAVTLERAGHTSRWVPNASRALDEAGATAPDVALVDLHLADGSGFEVAAALRAVCPGIRLVAVSGEVPGEAVVAQFDLFLLKPVALEAVLAAVEP